MSTGTEWRSRLAMPGWVLLPLRMFLGGTFLYAGLDKLADASYLDPSSPQSFASQTDALRDASPIGPLLDLALEHPTLFAVLIAVGEIAVGLGALAGLLTRLAAVGGMLLALTFWLTVSWETRPYYTGADVVYLVAWIPFVAVGAGGVLSVDAWLARRRAAAPTSAHDPRRRVLLETGLAAAGLAALGGGLAGLARSRRGEATPAASTGTPNATPAPSTPADSTPADSTPAPSTPASGSATGTPLASVADIPVGGAVQVTGAGGTPINVLQPTAGTIVAFSAVCPHAGCAVAWERSGRRFTCPCHASTFDATGAVTRGPARDPLAKLPVRVVDGRVFPA